MSNATRRSPLKHDYAEFFDFSEADEAAKAKVYHDFVEALSGELLECGIELPDARRLAERLWREMTGPGRHYHTPVHVMFMLAHAERLNLELTLAERLAVWYHDAIYEATASPGENEQASAQFLLQMLSPTAVDSGTLEQAATIVRSTANHKEAEVPGDHGRVLDLDLIGLSASGGSFERQSQAVRREMGHLSDERFALATIEFFRTLLARRSIYRTPSFSECESVARRQLENEIVRLSGQLA